MSTQQTTTNRATKPAPLAVAALAVALGAVVAVAFGAAIAGLAFAAIGFALAIAGAIQSRTNGTNGIWIAALIISVGVALRLFL